MNDLYNKHPMYDRLDPEVVEWFVEIAEDCDLEVYHNYSGRGMYGRKTIGVIGDFDQFCRFLQFLGTKLECNDREILGGWSSDSMGLSSIYYLNM